TFKSVAPVIVGSGLTIAGATYCLSFARLPYFSTMGAPVAIGMVVVVAIAVTRTGRAVSRQPSWAL
ncbi:MAG: MMPL family transporter, partial [Pseudolabrys sp.]